MIDGCGRKIDYLRLSLTDYCNLACRYCSPRGGLEHASLMDLGFAVAVVRWLSGRHGIECIRLTGGEPLLYPELIPLIEQLSEMDGVREISLTTNGQTLADSAESLRSAGLSRVNISLDTLKSKLYSGETNGGVLEKTIAGIEAATRVGFGKVKLNVVAQRDVNDGELVDIAYWGLSRGCEVRFLEVMAIGPAKHIAEKHLVPAAEILEKLRESFELKPIERTLGRPAEEFEARRGDVQGVIGLIAPTTRPFCGDCRRLRVTSGKGLVPCLHDSTCFDLGRFWDGQRLDENGADEVLQEAVRQKPEQGPRCQTVPMISLGG